MNSAHRRTTRERTADYVDLVVSAQAGDIKAFSALVVRFQDMAYGYSFSFLGDFHLAQDATQEAFVEAYRHLPQLAEPSAFPSWFRRVVHKHCDRLVRKKRLVTVPLESATEIPQNIPGPAEMTERRQLRDEVIAAVMSLPENERAATALYYIDGYSQREVAGFLEIPEKTVKSRLHRSRLRLKQRMMHMVDRTMKDSPLPAGFAEMVVRMVGSDKDLAGARKYLEASYVGKREPGILASVKAAQEADIYVVAEDSDITSAGYYKESDWAIGEERLSVVRPWEMANEAEGVPDPVFVKGYAGCFRMARDRGRTLSLVHGSMYDHGLCGFIPTFYYCVASLPVALAQDLTITTSTRKVTDREEQALGDTALLSDPYATKMTTFLRGGDLFAVEGEGQIVGYYRANPANFEKARAQGITRPFGYVNSITVRTRPAALAVLRHAAELAAEAKEAEVLILESHATLITRTILSLGGDYLLRPSCPLQGLDAEMAAILDFPGLTRQLLEEFTRRLRRTGGVPPARLSIQMGADDSASDASATGAVVGLVWNGGTLEVADDKQKAHLTLPRWLATRLYMGYYSGEEVLTMGQVPWDRSDGKNADVPGLDMQHITLPQNEAKLFQALFPKLWPCSSPDPDVWPWVIGEPHPTYQHEKAKTPEMKEQIDALRFPWIGY